MHSTSLDDYTIERGLRHGAVETYITLPTGILLV